MGLYCPKAYFKSCINGDAKVEIEMEAGSVIIATKNGIEDYLVTKNAIKLSGWCSELKDNKELTLRGVNLDKMYHSKTRAMQKGNDCAIKVKPKTEYDLCTLVIQEVDSSSRLN